ncbi:hypothetical protein Fcan01_25680 [Folsomia candida]|uniref:Uncharacterized protein n=1 Tax=Folsomia candida TaxID=158441 RepID=A0A226D4M5_FOLCA|nr:hypothetical protein Fcan01_25680 [Folsomia candida]
MDRKSDQAVVYKTFRPVNSPETEDDTSWVNSVSFDIFQTDGDRVLNGPRVLNAVATTANEANKSEPILRKIVFTRDGVQVLKCEYRCSLRYGFPKLPEIRPSYFVVVEFPNDKPVSVEAIPRTWLISETECWWPQTLKINQLKKKIGNKFSKPEPEWKKCQCRILGEKDDYHEAQKAAKIAEDRSDVENSGTEVKRSSRKPVHYSSSDGNGEDSDNDCGRKFGESNQENIPSAFVNNTEQSSLENEVVATTETHQGPIFLTLNNSTGLYELDASQGENYIGTSEPIVIEDNLSNSFQKVVLRYLAEIRSTRKELIKRVANLENLVEYIPNSSGLTSGRPNEVNSDTLPIFPLENEQQLSQLENQLEIEEERNNLINIFRPASKTSPKTKVGHIHTSEFRKNQKLTITFDDGADSMNERLLIIGVAVGLLDKQYMVKLMA